MPVHDVIYAGLLALLGVTLFLIRQTNAAKRALEAANLELGEAAARAEEARGRAEGLAQQKARLVAILDAALTSSPVAFAFFDRELRFLRVNQTFADLTGEDVADHLGLRLLDLNPHVAQQVDPKLRDVLATRRPVVNAELRVTAQGSSAVRNFGRRCLRTRLGPGRSAVWSRLPLPRRVS